MSDEYETITSDEEMIDIDTDMVGKQAELLTLHPGDYMQ